MPIEMSCPCGQLLRVGDEHAGKQARCPICGTVSTVVAPSANVNEVQPFRYEDASTLAPAPQTWSMQTPEGRIYGPVTKAEMDRWVSEGRVSADCRLEGGDGHWTSADKRYPVLSPKPTPTAGTSSQFTDSSFRSSAHPVTTAVGPQSSSQYVQPHRGPLILILGIVSWVMGCPIFGIVAWVMGSADLREMRMGRMDQAGMGLTQAGYILGMIHAMLFIVGSVIVLFIVVIATVARAAM
jgi:hypothetical protein